MVVDLSRHPFPVLLGGDGWAADFTAAEVTLLCRGVRALQAQHQALAAQLLAEEALTLEWEADGLWLELEAAVGGAVLRFILTAAPPRRSLEAGWRGTAVAAVTVALAALDLPLLQAPGGTDQQP